MVVWLEVEQRPVPAGSGWQSVGFSLGAMGRQSVGFSPGAMGSGLVVELGAEGEADDGGIQICISRIPFSLLYKKWTEEDQKGSRESREEAVAVVWAQDNGGLGWQQGGLWRSLIADPRE